MKSKFVTPTWEENKHNLNNFFIYEKKEEKIRNERRHEWEHRQCKWRSLVTIEKENVDVHCSFECQEVKKSWVLMTMTIHCQKVKLTSAFMLKHCSHFATVI